MSGLPGVEAAFQPKRRACLHQPGQRGLQQGTYLHTSNRGRLILFKCKNPIDSYQHKKHNSCWCGSCWFLCNGETGCGSRQPHQDGAEEDGHGGERGNRPYFSFIRTPYSNGKLNCAARRVKLTAGQKLTVMKLYSAMELLTFNNFNKFPSGRPTVAGILVIDNCSLAACYF